MPAAGWQKNLKRLVAEMRRQPRPVEYPFKRLQELVDAPTTSALNEELTRLVGRGEIDVFYRIRSSETGAGIAEYRRITDVPARVFDDTADTMQNVVLSRDVELIYRSPQ
ncbi:hypothetical protein X743_29765 [Mesorhizobium sp. LNHC252B00]|nr:hypothetical protein X743_29765 [Mesorhizobium sp. LNHC252B00]